MIDYRYLYVSVLLIAAGRRAASPHAPTEVPLPPAEIWFRPLALPADGHWIPDEAVVEAMKGLVDAELRSRVPKADQDRPAGEYWFVNSASIPESCHVSGLYIPSTKTVTGFSVGGFNCPARL